MRWKLDIQFFFKEAIDKVQLDNFKTNWTAGEILVNLKCVRDITLQLSGGRAELKAQSPHKMRKWLKVLYTTLKVNMRHVYNVFAIAECYFPPLTSVSMCTHSKLQHHNLQYPEYIMIQNNFWFLKNCFNFIHLTSNNVSQIMNGSRTDFYLNKGQFVLMRLFREKF